MPDKSRAPTQKPARQSGKAYKSLREFLEMLEEIGELKRVKTPVRVALDMTEIQTRLLAEGGPAVLFEQPVRDDGTISDIPVLVNLFGTVRRVAMGVTMEAPIPGGIPENNLTGDKTTLRTVGETLAFLRQPEPPGGLKDALGMLPLAKTVLAMKPITKKNAPCQEIVKTGDEVNLDDLPIQTCWPGEPAPLITWPLIVTKGPSNDKQDDFNLGIYRMQKLGANKAIMRWLKHRGGAQHHARWAKSQEKSRKSEPLPVAAVLGADPGMILAAVTPVPDTLSEYQFAGLMRGKKAELVDCITQPLKVPAEAEIILEGHVSLDEYEDEGPYDSDYTSSTSDISLNLYGAPT